jgi:small subunit ribosomal protein S21
LENQLFLLILHPCYKTFDNNYLKERESKSMIIVPVKEGESIDRALKKLKRKFEKTGVVKELRERQKFTKPSVKHREEVMKAIYIQKLQQAEEGM